MPGIKLNFEFDINAFEFDIVDKSKHIQQRLKYCLESFDSKIRGNTTIGQLRTSLFEAVHKSNQTLFAKCKGIDLWFNNELLDCDYQTIIDIVGLWNNSVITITPSKSVLHFIDAFLNHSEFPQSNNRNCFHSLIWNALNESVQSKNLKIWDMFCAQILKHWSENKRYFDFEARIFLHYLLQFDPKPLRDYVGWKLMNVMMGTGLSDEILRKLLFDDRILWEADCHGSNALMHCILENDIVALDYLIQFGVNFDEMIDDINTINDFITIYGSIEMSFMSQEYRNIIFEKKEIILNHKRFLTEGIPMDLVREIASFLFSADDIKSVKESNQEIDEQNIDESIFDEIKECIKTYGKVSGTISNEYPSTSESVEIISVYNRQESSTNNLFEIEQRLSIISCASN